MGYYKMLAVIFLILILSVFVQGRELFSDAFFAIAYAVMSVALFIGTKFRESSRSSLSIGMLLIFSVGFLSTNTLVEFFTKAQTTSLFFKLAIIASLDFCALFFLRYGRESMKTERFQKARRFGPYEIKGKPPVEKEEQER